MKQPPTASAPPAPAPAAPGAWVRFWFTPTDPVGLHVLRVLAGLLFLAWLVPLAGQHDALFGLQGWFDRRAYADAARLPDGPPAPLGWSVLFLCGGDPVLLNVAYGAALAVLVLFTAGLWTRVTSVLTWVVVASFLVNPAVDDDVNCLLAVLAFYLMAGYLLLGLRSGSRSLAARLFGPADALLFRRAPAGGRRPSLGANLALRLLQVHLALILVTSGLHKLQFGDWWAGVAFWYPLNPPLRTTAEGLRALARHSGLYLTALSVAAYATLAWQIGFPLFAWRRRWRPLLLAGAAAAWLGCALVYQLPLFGPAVFVACLSYLTPEEWHGLGALPARLRGLLRRQPAPVYPAPHVRKKAKTASVVAMRNP